MTQTAEVAVNSASTSAGALAGSGRHRQRQQDGADHHRRAEAGGDHLGGVLEPVRCVVATPVLGRSRATRTMADHPRWAPSV